MTRSAETVLDTSGERVALSALGVSLGGRVKVPAAQRNRLINWALDGSGWVPLVASIDGVGAAAGTALATVAYSHHPGLSHRWVELLLMPVLTVSIFYLRGLYRIRIRPLLLDWLLPTVGATALAALAVIALSEVVGAALPTERVWLSAWAYALLFVVVGRSLLFYLQGLARKRRLVGRPVLIVGAGQVGSQLARRLEARPEYGLRPVGLIDDDPPDLGRSPERYPAVPVVGGIDEVEEVIRRTGVRHLIVAFPTVADSRLSPLIQRCQELGVEVTVVPRMFDWLNNRISYEAVGGLPLLTCHVVAPSSRKFALKYALDRLAAALLLLLSAPVMAVVAILIKVTSPGPVIYRQLRVGHDGKTFYLLKFRSMREGGETAKHHHWLRRGLAPGGVEGEDRRTAIGKIIRRTGLDELPQLLNVVKGEMSLIGPRPERPEFVDLFKEEINRYGDRLRVKSGITGLAQVCGLRGQTSLQERVELDNYYISHWSFGLDLKILLMTFATPFQGVE
jgi:exopolysaccharide biosynthesis polyprenyl glycosylphosphotransferase